MSRRSLGDVMRQTVARGETSSTSTKTVTGDSALNTKVAGELNAVNQAAKHREQVFSKLQNLKVDAVTFSAAKDSGNNYTVGVKANLGVPETLPAKLAKTLTGESKPFDNAIHHAVMKRVNNVVFKHRAAYLSYLKSLEGLLTDPNAMKVNPADKSETVSLSIEAGVFDQKAKINVRWNQLSEFTIEKKKKKRIPMRFWFHSGELSRAFSRSVAMQERSHIDTSGFIDQQSVAIVAGRTGKVFNPTEFAHTLAKSNGKTDKFLVSFNLALPKWVGPDRDLMDEVITKPYTSGQSYRTGISSSVLLKSVTALKVRQHERKLRNKLKDTALLKPIALKDKSKSVPIHVLGKEMMQRSKTLAHLNNQLTIYSEKLANAKYKPTKERYTLAVAQIAQAIAQITQTDSK